VAGIAAGRARQGRVCGLTLLVCKAVCPDGGSAVSSLDEDCVEHCIHVSMLLYLLMKVPFWPGCGVCTCGFWGARLHDEQEGPKVRCGAFHIIHRGVFPLGHFLGYFPYFTQRLACPSAPRATSCLDASLRV